jgi:hypothetical protein
MRLEKCLLFSALFLAVASLVHAQPACSLDTILGTYAVRGHSTVFMPVAGAAQPVVVPAVHIGIFSVDPGGNATATFAGSMGGEADEASATGTVEVNEDCTGLLTYTMLRAGVTIKGKAKFVITENGNEIVTVATESDAVKAVVGETMKRLSRLPLNLFTEQTPCIPEMLRGTYAFHYEGTMFTIPQGATAPVAVPSCSVGVSWIDTSNRMPGLATANVGGVSREGGWTTPPYPGTIESNCMGTMAWSTAV